MKKTKEQKGITLIALIITIVVLMILAAVAINSITNDGIISKAEGAVNKYTEAQNEEKKMLEYYELMLEGTAWTQNGTTVSRNGQTLNVGDEIAIVTGTNTSTPYTANNVSEWRVLGAEYGKLLLVSAENVEDEVWFGGLYGGYYYEDIEAEVDAGYLNGVEYLNTLCSAYRNTEYADEARSIKVEDINRVTGYNPETAYDENYEFQYGDEVTYTMDPSGYVAYSSGGKSGVSGYTTFITLDNKTLGKDVSEVKVTQTGYDYTVTDLSEAEFSAMYEDEVTWFVITDFPEPAYSCLGCCSYWLASYFVTAWDGDVSYRLPIYSDGVNNEGMLVDTDPDQGYEGSAGVRAVVSLLSDVQVVKV